jgi:hypothetical protein
MTFTVHPRQRYSLKPGVCLWWWLWPAAVILNDFGPECAESNSCMCRPSKTLGASTDSMRGIMPVSTALTHKTQPRLVRM